MWTALCFGRSNSGLNLKGFVRGQSRLQKVIGKSEEPVKFRLKMIAKNVVMSQKTSPQKKLKALEFALKVRITKNWFSFVALPWASLLLWAQLYLV